MKFDLDLLNSFCLFVKNIYQKVGFIQNRELDIIKRIINKFTSLFTLDSNKAKLLSDNKDKNNSKPNVVLTITSCKRLDLFSKTINSLLTTWLDIDKIDYFICIDDNSSNEDRKNMLKNYPFFKFIFKKENEKGHLTSMNMIWDKLNELKPKYWIHLEDDWLFFKPDNYVQKSISFLEKYREQNIHQILFNKGYGEIIDDFNLVGGQILDTEKSFYLHIKDEPNLAGRNSAYWPHYSFRPSMIRTDKILKLGNFTSPNTFFERDYADKYFSKGYLSAFFNEITCIHTGRLTSERNNSDKKNAYQLNGISQFTDNENNQQVQQNNQTKNIQIKKINDNYIFFHSLDHFGDDVCFIPNLSTEEMINVCEKDENIVCFNNLGYFKNNINLESLMNFGDDTKGLYVNLTRLKEKFNINIQFAQ